MLIVYLMASFTSAAVAGAIVAQSSWLAAIIAAPLAASLLTLLLAGVSYGWTSSARRAITTSDVPSGIVWC